ncbi:hypothetical protein DFA_00473 [Cavenderia fasciculata]|uniref:Uncharacterized protein n=1 Tax=Cavenderia fasciculata TaxID=261658 RepID=F4PS14_CACFS|nr:uncharacterized protein DFA_00473 [Cavenderia fasciculata]EGG20612.1 hypothetical protein DFA_00473 [Cavenderia fasciculata]|eukprot:XP_004358462.1 hypothetical protein DFA_00473 [Cavenderia fasciculata]
MEEPDEDFLETIVILAQNLEKKSKAKQQYQDYSDDAEQVVSWLLFLIVKGTYPAIMHDDLFILLSYYSKIKEKAIQLLDRLVDREGTDLIGFITEPLMDDIKVELIELLKSTLTDTFKQHLFSIILSFANYLIPRGRWIELEKDKLDRPSSKVNNQEEDDNEDEEEEKEDDKEEEEEEESIFQDNAKALLQVLSEHDFQTEKQEILKELFRSDDYNTELTDEQYKSYMPTLLSILEQMVRVDDDEDDDDEELLKSIIEGLNHVISISVIWIEYIKPINGAMVKILDNVSSSRKMVLDILLILARNTPTKEKESQIDKNDIERIIYHLNDWLADESLKDWRRDRDASARADNFYNFDYNIEDDNDVPPEYSVTDPFIEQEYHFGDIISNMSRFVSALGQRASVLAFKHFNTMLNSKSWEERFAILISLSQSCHSDDRIMHQFFTYFDILYRSALKLVNDQNIQVRWLSFQCLIRLSVEFPTTMVESRQEIFQVIGKSIQSNISDEHIQNRCCVLFKKIIPKLTKGMIDDIVLDGFCNSIQILVQSPKSYLVEKSLVLFTKFIQKTQMNFAPNYRNISQILLSLLEKQTDSQEIYSLAIKAFSMCDYVMDNNITYAKDLNKVMKFIKKEEWSFDRIVNTFRDSDLLNGSSGNSFALYLPMFMRMLLNILETPLPNRQDEIEKVSENLRDFNCITINRIKGDRGDGPLAPYVGRLVGILFKLAVCPVREIRQESLFSIPACLKQYKLHFGSYNHNTLELFDKIINSVLNLCLVENNVSCIHNHIYAVVDSIKEMGPESMTIGQVQFVMDTFYKIEQKLEGIAQQVSDGIQDVIETHDPEDDIPSLSVETLVVNYMMIEEMFERNGAIATPLITSHFLDRICQKLHDTEQEDSYTKRGILDFIFIYVKNGGESAINTFPRIIPAIIQCLSHSNDSVTLRISCYTLGKIAEYVPQVSNVNFIIQKWLSTLPIKKDIAIMVDTLFSIIRLYPKECLGQQYQHVVKIHQIITHYMTDCQQKEKQQLYQIWLFIKESFEANWDRLSKARKDTLSNLERITNTWTI